MNSLLARLTGCGLLAVGLAAETAAGERPVILFELGGKRDATTVVEPITMLRGGPLEEVPVVFSIGDSAQQHDRAKRANDALALTAFPQGAHLWELVAGRAVGQVKITGHYDEDGVHSGCAWFSIPVTAVGDLGLPSKKPMLAINAATAVDTGFLQRAPSERAGRMLDHTARALFRKSGVAAPNRKRMVRAHAAEYYRPADGRTMLLADFRIETVEDRRQAMDGLHALFVVLERTRGRWLLAHHAYRFGADADMESEYAIDIIDIDGDRRPEIVTRIVQYESWYFAVHRKRAGRWERAFAGGGGGC